MNPVDFTEYVFESDYSGDIMMRHVPCDTILSNLNTLEEFFQAAATHEAVHRAQNLLRNYRVTKGTFAEQYKVEHVSRPCIDPDGAVVPMFMEAVEWMMNHAELCPARVRPFASLLGGVVH